MAIGSNRQAVWRWEAKGQMPTAAQEAILVEATKLTPLAFVEILCKVLSRFLENAQVVVAPGVDHLPRASASHATKLYRANYRLLDPARRAAILEWVVEQISMMLEEQIAQEIGAAGGAEQVH